MSPTPENYYRVFEEMMKRGDWERTPEPLNGLKPWRRKRSAYDLFIQRGRGSLLDYGRGIELEEYDYADDVDFLTM